MPEKLDSLDSRESESYIRNRLVDGRPKLLRIRHLNQPVRTVNCAETQKGRNFCRLLKTMEVRKNAISKI